MITFKEHRSHKYPPRTYENASADATIAFAFDFNTAGERLTMNAVVQQGKIYTPVHPLFINSLKVKTTAELLINKSVKTLNIAGNSLPTVLKHSYTQMACDALVYLFLKMVLSHPVLHGKIELIRSGGQSGFDEAGIKAAVKLGIPALIVCPKGWKFLNEHGETICDEVLFKQRFELCETGTVL